MCSDTGDLIDETRTDLSFCALVPPGAEHSVEDHPAVEIPARTGHVTSDLEPVGALLRHLILDALPRRCHDGFRHSSRIQVSRIRCGVEYHINLKISRLDGE